MSQFPDAFNRNHNYLVEALVCMMFKMEVKNTVLEAVVHNFAIMDSDPEGGIVEKQLGQCQSNIRSAIN